MQDELRANRSLLNTAGGYWVLGTDPEAARQMEIGAIPLGAGTRISGLLVTDGFYRLVDIFGACRDDTALLAEAREHGLEALLYRLRALEDADPDCIVHPRLKPTDDATALLGAVADVVGIEGGVISGLSTKQMPALARRWRSRHDDRQHSDGCRERASSGG